MKCSRESVLPLLIVHYKDFTPPEKHIAVASKTGRYCAVEIHYRIALFL